MYEVITINHNILVIDDEENIRELIRFNLEEAGYTVVLATDGQEALCKLNTDIDLIILDLMLPKIDGLSLCRQIRKDPEIKEIPIIMLTARADEMDRILGLDLGADDYVTKPFSPRELIARINAVLRRIPSLDREDNIEEGEIITKGSLQLNLKSYEVQLGENKIELTPKEFKLLKLLLLNPNQVMTREVLLDKVWGYDYAGETRTVDVHIRRLREKLGAEFIETVRGVGYKFAVLE